MFGITVPKGDGSSKRKREADGEGSGRPDAPGPRPGGSVAMSADMNDVLARYGKAGDARKRCVCVCVLVHVGVHVNVRHTGCVCRAL